MDNFVDNEDVGKDVYIRGEIVQATPHSIINGRDNYWKYIISIPEFDKEFQVVAVQGELTQSIKSFAADIARQKEAEANSTREKILEGINELQSLLGAIEAMDL